MNRPKPLGPDIQNLYTYAELPIGATSIGLPSGRKTGLWRYMRPVFAEKTPPCQNACPLGNWIQHFVTMVAQDKLDEAWWALRLENPFPGVCGRVCYHPCESACNRKELDGATSIQAIERYLADHFFNASFTPPITRATQGKKTAVVGSGPAGLACAFFLAMMGYEVSLFEALDELGGIPQIGIPAYRLPKDVLNKEIDDILSLGIEVKKRCRVGVDMPFSQLLDYDVVFLATGAHREPPLGIQGEERLGVYRGLKFLSQFNREKSIELGEKILVIGGGNVAVDVVRTLFRLNRHPLLLYRRTRTEMPAFSEEIDEALDEGVEIQYLLSPTAIHKSNHKRLVLECAKMRNEGFDKDGRARVVPIKGESIVFQADQIILATGEAPDLSYLDQDLQVADGLIQTNEWGQTNYDKVFAGGDIIGQPWTVSEAIGSAKRAAIAIDHFLRGEDLAELAKRGALAHTMREHLGIDGDAPNVQREMAAIQDLNLAYGSPLTRRKGGKLSLGDRTKNFDEVNLGMGHEEALQEAERCLSCGVCKMCGNCYLFCPDSAITLDPEIDRYVINYEYCKGCGICANECPVGAISIQSEGET
jgi:NADPH-dependent glutamate synthase beta subunit-like oxidoreductase